MTDVNWNDKKKLIVSDLDGTLLRSDKTISEFTDNILKKCRDAGIYLAFATARPIRAVTEYLDIIKPIGRIYHNGAIAYYKNDILSTNQIDYVTALNILSKAKYSFPKLKMAYEANDTLYANFDTSILWNNTEYTLTDFTDIPPFKIDKIIVDFESNPDVLLQINSFMPDDVYTEIVDNKLALIMNIHASKHNTISTLTKKLGISINNVVAFGDDNNDIGMLKLCGTGVAMQNARKDVKLAADYICTSNDGDGVARWIAEHVLNNKQI